jgi:MFS family permease
VTTTRMTTTSTERWVLILSSIASLMVALDVLVVSTALGAIRRHLGASLNDLEWTVNAYALSFAVLLIGAASVGDRFGRRRLFAAGLGLFALGSVACALAPNAGLLIAARAALGIVWGLMRGNDAGWGSLEVVDALAAGALALIAFLLWEARTREPMLPLRLFSARGFSLGSASNFLLSACLFSAVFFMAQFQQISLHQGPLDSGLRLLPWTATLFIVAPIAGSLVARIGERVLVVSGLLLQAAGMAWIALVATPGMAYIELVAPLAIAGAGISMAIPAVQNAVMNAVGPGDLGQASGVSMMTRQLGGVFGVAIGVAVFSGAGSYASASAFGDGFGPALAVAAAFSLLGAACATGLPRLADTAVRSSTSGAMRTPGSGASRAPASGTTAAVGAAVTESTTA